MENFGNTNKDSDEKLSWVERGAMIMTHELDPASRQENQLKLAHDVFEIKKSRKVSAESHEEREEVMQFWFKEFAKAYADLEEDNAFKFHPRLSGDIYKITGKDMVTYQETGELPD